MPWCFGGRGLIMLLQSLEQQLVLTNVGPRFCQCGAHEREGRKAGHGDLPSPAAECSQSRLPAPKQQGKFRNQ